MSDFTSNFWSVFVAAISIIGILYCAFLLWFSAKVKVAASHDTEDGTTGHVWDGDLREMNNPLPRWWLWLFIITMVFAVVYGVAYPGLGSYAGKLGYASAGAMADFIVANMVAEAASGSKTPKEAAERAQKRAERYYKL